MSYVSNRNVDFGVPNTGLSTVGYTVYKTDGTTEAARTTSGVSELVTGSGIYYANVTLPDAFAGSILWDTGTTPNHFATEEIQPQLSIIERYIRGGYTYNSGTNTLAMQDSSGTTLWSNVLEVSGGAITGRAEHS